MDDKTIEFTDIWSLAIIWLYTVRFAVAYSTHAVILSRVPNFSFYDRSILFVDEDISSVTR